MEFYDLIVRDDKTSMSLYDFLLCHGFDDKKFDSWIETKRDEWFVLNDELINTLGHKRRAVLLRFIRSQFIESTDYVVISTRIVRVTRHNEHYKRDIRMRKRSFCNLLVKLDTKVSRDIHEYLCDMDYFIHKYDVYKKECELHSNDAFIRELQNEHECIVLIILGYMSFVLFVTMMYFLV